MLFGSAQSLSRTWKLVVVHIQRKYSKFPQNRQSYGPIRLIILKTLKNVTFFKFLKFKTRKSTWNVSSSTRRKLLHHWDGRGAFAGVSPSSRRGKESEGNTASDWPNWNGLIEVMHSRKYWFCCRCRCSVYLTGTSTLFSLNTCSPPPPQKKLLLSSPQTW